MLRNYFFCFFIQVDVIVNIVLKDLNLSYGVVLVFIFKLGGDSIQQECKIKYLEGISFGEIVIIGGGKLGCKIVCYGVFLFWDKGIGNLKNVSIFFNIKCIFF